MLVKIENLKLTINNKLLFENLNFELKENSVIGISGPTGTGKTSILNYISGISFYKQLLFEGKKEEAPNLKISYVFQEPRLLNNLTVLENVMLPLQNIYSPSEAKLKAESVLKELFLEDKINLFPNELSGGEKQRVSIARALAYPGKVLLFDEPFSAQDEAKRAAIISYIKKIQLQENRGIILVSHYKQDFIEFSSLFTIEL